MLSSSQYFQLCVEQFRIIGKTNALTFIVAYKQFNYHLDTCFNYQVAIFQLKTGDTNLVPSTWQTCQDTEEGHMKFAGQVEQKC